MQTKLYNQQGSEIGTVELAEGVFGLSQNFDLVQQVRVGLLANKRNPVAHVKDRSEVRGGGRKPWRQKGTGRARHGSRRSPIWKGGGVAHGPRNEKDYSQKINSRMIKKALRTVLSAKLRHGQVTVVNDFFLDSASTGKFKSIFQKIIGGDIRNTILVLPWPDGNIIKSGRNLGVGVENVANMSFINLLKAKKIVFTESAIKKIEK